MTTPDELLRLAERVEQGSGVDDRLRRDLVAALDIAFADGREVLTSLDAVEALRLRLLPMKHELTSRLVDGTWTAIISVPGYRANYGDASTEARARLAALLRAVAGKEA